MNQLFSLIENDVETPLLKAIVTFFEILFIKPFEKNNDQIAILMFKKILFSAFYNKNIYLLPIEKILKDDVRINFLINETYS